MSTRLRVIFDGAMPAAWNMAVDETLLDGAGPTDRVTLRLYRWRRPTVSLGYAQAWREGFDPIVGRRQGIALVRRVTGGRAVLHADELTYSIAGPADQGPLEGGIHATYRKVARGLVAGLRAFGVEAELVRGVARREAVGGACFAARARHELVADGRKLAGSAQRRRAGRVLQHGSLPIGRPDPRLWAALGPAGAMAAADSIGVAELTGVRPGWRELATTLAEAVARELSLEPVTGTLSNLEVRGARARSARYRSPEFTLWR